MGNRFREKTVEEGLDGDVAREALQGATESGRGNLAGERQTEGGRSTGNRRRVHAEEAEQKRAKKEKEPEVKEEKPLQPEPKEELPNPEPYAHDEVEESDDSTATEERGGRIAKGVAKVLGGDILGDKLVMGQIKLLLLCMVFLLLLVANRYQVESLSRKKMALQERVNELREQQIQLQKKNQNSIRISQIRDDLEREKGLGILPTPPNVI